MEIAIEKSRDTYTVTVGGQPIVAVWPRKDEDIKEFVRTVRRIHGNRKKKNLIVGLLTENSTNYSNACIDFELMALCVEQHCLFVLLERNFSVSKVIQDFLYDRKTVVVGVGIERAAEKLEKDYGLLIPRRLELREVAEAHKIFKGSALNFGKISLMELARAVLGEEVVYVRPTKMKWWEVEWKKFSDDLVKYSTVDAFLAAQIGTRLLRN